jgi:hypothetical protein
VQSILAAVDGHWRRCEAQMDQYGDITVTQARELAIEQKARIALGGDPGANATACARWQPSMAS